MRKTEAEKSEAVTSGSGDGNGPYTKECRWPLEAGKGKKKKKKKMYSPLEPPDSNTALLTP